jgi:hypothetical protein
MRRLIAELNRTPQWVAVLLGLSLGINVVLLTGTSTGRVLANAAWIVPLLIVLGTIKWLSNRYSGGHRIR